MTLVVKLTNAAAVGVDEEILCIYRFSDGCVSWTVRSYIMYNVYDEGHEFKLYGLCLWDNIQYISLLVGFMKYCS